MNRQFRSTGGPEESRAVKMRILDKEVQLSCRPGDEDALAQAAAYIDRSMRELRQRNATSTTEKIAIVTAINTANELLRARNEQVDENSIGGRLDKLSEQLARLEDDDSADSPDN